MKSWSAKGPGRHHFQMTHAALNLCRAIESRWKRNWPSLSSAETLLTILLLLLMYFRLGREIVIRCRRHRRFGEVVVGRRWSRERRDCSRQVVGVCVTGGVPLRPRASPARPEPVPAAGQCPRVVRPTDRVHRHHLPATLIHSAHDGWTAVALLACRFVTVSLHFLF